MSMRKLSTDILRSILIIDVIKYDIKYAVSHQICILSYVAGDVWKNMCYIFQREQNIYMYLHFISFPNIDMAHAVKNLPRLTQELTYSA